MSEVPTNERMRYRCSACGNKTRFLVTRTMKVETFVHTNLGGKVIETTDEILAEQTERIFCNRCGATEGINLVLAEDQSP